MDTVHRVSATPVIDTNQYASGDVLGALMTFSVAALRDAGGVVLDQVLIRDKSKQQANVDLVLFDADPTNSTFTDNQAMAVHANDMAKVIGAISVTTHVPFNANSISLAKGTGLLVKAPEKVYGLLVARATPTYAALALQVELGFRAAR
jgi:hypothetical protein